jgi:hypothetical protein
LHTWSSFERLREEDWLFVRHLSDEGERLWDPSGEFQRRSHVSFPGDRAVIGEIHSHGCGLDRLTDLDRYDGDFLFPLADLYGLTKRIAMLANSRVGLSTFQRDRALFTCAELFPKVAADVARVASLAPFYALTHGVRSMRAPFSSDGADGELLASAASLRRVIDAVTVG